MGFNPIWKTGFKATRKALVEAAIGIALMVTGIFVLLWTYTLINVDFVDVWARRFYTILALELIALGYAFSKNGIWKKIKWFFLISVLLHMMFWAVGVNLGFDASNSFAQNISNTWVLYDTGFADIGLGVKLIGQAANDIVPIALLCLIVYQVLYSGEADENMKSLLEGGVVLGFVLAFKFVGNLSINQLLMLVPIASLAPVLPLLLAFLII